MPVALRSIFDRRSDVVVLTMSLAAIVALGWLMGAVVTGVLSAPTLAHVDGPVKQFFTAHRQLGWMPAMQKVTVVGSDRVVLPVALAAGLLLSRRRSMWRPLMLTTAAYGGAAFIAVFDKVAVGRSRSPGDGLASVGHLAFPSGHATQAMAVYGTVAESSIVSARRRSARLAIGVAASTVVVSVAVSRVYLGVHWLTDVVGGLLLGAAWAAALAVVERRRSCRAPSSERSGGAGRWTAMSSPSRSDTEPAGMTRPGDEVCEHGRSACVSEMTSGRA